MIFCFLLFINIIFAECKEINYDELNFTQIDKHEVHRIFVGDMICTHDGDCHIVDKITHDIRINGEIIYEPSNVDCVYPCDYVINFRGWFCSKDTQPFNGNCRTVVNDCEVGELPSNSIYWRAYCEHDEEDKKGCDVNIELTTVGSCYHDYIIGVNVQKDSIKCGNYNAKFAGWRIYHHSINTGNQGSFDFDNAFAMK